MSESEPSFQVEEKPLPEELLQRKVVITITTINVAWEVLERDFHVSERDHLVILVHGIFTRAHWMQRVKPALEGKGFHVVPTSYGEYGVSSFLKRSDWPRQRAIKRVVRNIRTAIKSHTDRRGVAPRRKSIISHSFGTYVVSRILDEETDLKWYRIIFCGSVVRDDYRLDRAMERFTPNLLNEVGTRDFWPALGESAGWDYGSIGSHGFNDPLVHTRWHKGFWHSSFLTEEFTQKFWIPFLQGNEPIPADAPTVMPLVIRGIARLPLRWLLLPVLFCLPIYSILWRALFVLIFPLALWWLGWWLGWLPSLWSLWRWPFWAH